MTSKQVERVLEAEDILIEVMHEIEDNGRDTRSVKRLDTIISKIENLLQR